MELKNNLNCDLQSCLLIARGWQTDRCQEEASFTGKRRQMHTLSEFINILWAGCGPQAVS